MTFTSRWHRPRFADIFTGCPPMLMLSGTRHFALSSSVWTHDWLTKLKIDSALHVWEGNGHDLLYQPQTPETREAYEVIASFFATRLGRDAIG